MTGFIVVAVLIVAGILFLTGRGIAFRCRCTASGSAKVSYLDEIEARRSRAAEKSVVYVPVYEYEVDNMIYHFRIAKESRDPNKFKHGQEYKIKYNPKKPSECTMDGMIARCVLQMEKSNEKEILERIRRGNI